MAVRYVTVAQARVISGIAVTLISDADMTQMIEEIEFQVERFLNTNYTPSLRIDVIDGEGKSYVYTQKAPLLALRALESNDATIALSDVSIKRSGKIDFNLNQTSTSSQGVFTKKKRGVRIKYLHGGLAWDKTTQTSTDADASAGTSVALSVASESGFTTNDYIEITGFDGNKEVTKITGTSSGEITVDTISYDHESGSLINLMVVPQTIRRLMEVMVGLGSSIRAVGQSFDDITGYTMGEFQVQKGEPFTQFREAILRFSQERDEIFKRVRPAPGVVM